MGFSIIGTGSAAPEKVVSNLDLAAIMDTSDEWIRTRTGITERHVLNGESLEDLCVLAGQRALEDSGIDPMELDYLICATMNGDYTTPSLSSQLQKRLGTKAVCFDINAACSGFIYALEMADTYLNSGRAKKILVIGGDAVSRLADWQDRASCILFGDGAGAAVLSNEGNDLIEIHLTTDGSLSMLYAQSPRGNCPFSEKSEGSPYLIMNGQEVYRFAVSAIERDINLSLERSGLSTGDIDLFLLHQANRRIIDAARHKLGLNEEKFPMNIDHYGNTSSATVPMLLDELAKSGRVKKGSTLLLSAFGAGLTTGCCIIKWSKQN